MAQVITLDGTRKKGRTRLQMVEAGKKYPHRFDIRKSGAHCWVVDVYTSNQRHIDHIRCFDTLKDAKAAARLYGKKGKR